jgi:hypothetical protein
MTRTLRALIAISALAQSVLGCGPGSKGGPTISGKLPSGDLAPPVSPPVSPVVSVDILAREPVSNTATVKHILISWRELGDAFQGHLDPRAEKRSKADAEAEVRSLVKQLQDGTDFDTVMKAHSEDVGSAMSGRTFTVTPDAQLVIEFRQLSLRLRPGEIGVCQSDFGFHIIKRVS